MNTQILLTGGPALEKILVHLRDSPGRPCLVHCTGGLFLSARVPPLRMPAERP